MVSKMVTDRQKEHDDLKAWSNEHRSAIAGRLKARVGTGGEVELLAESLMGAVSKSLKALIESDEAHTAEQADDAAPRAERDEAAGAVQKGLQELRNLVEPMYGLKGLTALGLQDRVPRDPVQLNRVGKRVVEMSSADGFKMPPAKPGVSIDVQLFVGDLKPQVTRLAKSLAVVDKEAAELQTTQKAKADAFEAFDARFVAVTGVFRHLAALADMREMADKLPSLSKGGGPTTGADEPGPPPPPA